MIARNETMTTITIDGERQLRDHTKLGSINDDVSANK